MKKAYAVFGALLFVSLVVAVSLWASADPDPPLPTAAFIAAALDEQATGKSPALDVKYEYWEEDDSLKATVHYVRTPEILFIEHVIPGGPTTLASFDKRSGEFRQLTTTSQGSHTGLVDNKMGVPLSSRLVMDPCFFCLNQKTVTESVRTGTVADARESVMGASCFRIGTQAVGNAEKCTVWCDPAIGFCPRKAEIVRSGDKTQTIEFLDYKDIGNGVWFPTEIHNRFTVVIAGAPAGKPFSGNMHFTSRVKEVRLGSSAGADKLVVVFPAGTQVRDKVHDAAYQVP